MESKKYSQKELDGMMARLALSEAAMFGYPKHIIDENIVPIKFENRKDAENFRNLYLKLKG